MTAPPPPTLHARQFAARAVSSTIQVLDANWHRPHHSSRMNPPISRLALRANSLVKRHP